MATVNVNTDELTTKGNNITNANVNVKEKYNDIISSSINNCESYDNFKSKIKSQYTTYTDHYEKISERIIECANALEDIESQIANSAFETASSENTETTSSITITTNIDELVNLDENERTKLLEELSTSLTETVSNIEVGNYTYKSNSNYDLVNKLIDEFTQSISSSSTEVNDLIKNDFYNEVVKKYGELTNTKITPDMLHYASRNGLPLIRENISEYNLTFKGTNQPTEVGQEYDLYTMGILYGDEKTSYYSSQKYNSTGTYERKYSYYPDSLARHYNTENWYACDDGIYRDADGYIVCADRYNMGYNADGSERIVKQIIDSNEPTIVDTPFGKGKVYDFCRAGNIDIYVHK
jgi:hypothetical protein